MRLPLQSARAIVLCALISVCTSAGAQSPEESLHRFYSWVLAHPSRGLPSAAERGELAQVLSADLIEALKTASETEARCIEAAPKGDKPFIVEGDLFVGNHEGATEVAYGSSRREAGLLVAEADLFYVDDRFPKAHKHRAVGWKDRVEMRLIGGRWHVSDVRFHHNRSLLASLKSYVAEGKRTCSLTDRRAR